MADTKNFRSEYGYNSGTNEVINSSGKVVANAVSTLTTDNLTEGSSNVYYTNARHDSRFDTKLAAATIDGGTF
tara:strand:+ start:25533 stop:25751 length:219 start_codon:yes stop_codon:yes gene_type:complete